MRRGSDKPKKYDEHLSAMEAAELVEVSARTLMRYEKLGLVLPRYKGKTRLYSAQDVEWLRCLRELIHGRKISIAALKKLLKNAPCLEINDCRHDEYADCMKSSGMRHTGGFGAPASRGQSSKAASGSPRKRASWKKRINKS